MTAAQPADIERAGVIVVVGIDLFGTTDFTWLPHQMAFFDRLVRPLPNYGSRLMFRGSERCRAAWDAGYSAAMSDVGHTASGTFSG
jgi:hypothetical protein